MTELSTKFASWKLAYRGNQTGHCYLEMEDILSRVNLQLCDWNTALFTGQSDIIKLNVSDEKIENAEVNLKRRSKLKYGHSQLIDDAKFIEVPILVCYLCVLVDYLKVSFHYLHLYKLLFSILCVFILHSERHLSCWSWSCRENTELEIQLTRNLILRLKATSKIHSWHG